MKKRVLSIPQIILLVISFLPAAGLIITSIDGFINGGQGLFGVEVKPGWDGAENNFVWTALAMNVIPVLPLAGIFHIGTFISYVMKRKGTEPKKRHKTISISVGIIFAAALVLWIIFVRDVT